MNYLISYLLELVSHFLFLIIFVVDYYRLRQWRYGVMIVTYLITTALLTKVMWMGMQNNVHLYNVLFVFSGVGFSLYFLTLLQERWKQVLSLVLGTLTVVYYVVNNTWYGKEELFDSLGYVLIALSFIVITFLYFHTLLSHVTDELLSLNFDFWFICAQLVYNLGAFGIFLSYNYLTRKIIEGDQYSQDNRFILTYLWGVHNVLLFISALVTAIGL